MKIKIENFGIIKEFNFDSNKDLTLIFGENSTGKSYAISVIYLILKYLTPKYFTNMLNVFKKLNIENLAKAIEKKIQNNNKINIKKDIENIFKILFEENFLKNLEDSFSVTFNSINTLQNQFSKNKMKITVNLDSILFEIVKKSKHLKIGSLQINMDKFTFEKYEADISIFIIASILSISDKIKNEVSNIHYLPASRSGLYQSLSAFGQIFAELAKSRHLIRSSIEIPAISEPLSDYYLSISSIKSKKIEESFYNKIASKIEETILNGKVSFDEQIKKVVFEPNETNLKLDLAYTSSMVSEISPIVAFLRYVIDNENKNAKTIIFIEEPEAHLHPKIQIKLMEIFAELTSDNIKIVITTHSDYMFNKFNNLILKKSIDREKALSIQFKETKEGSVAKEIVLDEFGAEDENFIEASQDLYNEKLELIEELNSNN